MNPDRVYRQYRDDALANQIGAKEYSTFVAMPFGERFSYRSCDILSHVIQRAAARATEMDKAPRPFGQPTRVDDHSGGARVITESIVQRILECHIYLADLTFENVGVLLETGVALGMKPNAQIVLITQGKLGDLRFDIRNNNVISYNERGEVDVIAEAMIDAANSFESDKEKYVSAISRTLTPDAILCLRRYGEAQKQNRSNSLHNVNAEQIFGNIRPQERFEHATTLLLERRLLWTDWKVGVSDGVDAFGMHATDLGWAVMTTHWNDLTKPVSEEEPK